MKNSNVPSFKSPLNRSTFNVFETQDMELRTSRLIETCSNSFKDKTEDGWVVTRAKTKVSGRLNCLPLSEMFCTAVWSSTQHQTSMIFSPGGSRGAADFPLPRGAQGLYYAIAMHCLDIYAKSVKKKLWPG